MYRLLRLKGLSQTHIQTLSKQYYVNNLYTPQPNKQTCNFFKQYNDNISIKEPVHVIRRYRSTTTSATTAPLRAELKRIKRNQKPKKLTELLEVNSVTTNETTASVTKLGAKQLTKLMSNIDISLAELHKIKPKRKPRKPKTKTADDLAASNALPNDLDLYKNNEKIVNIESMQSFEDFPILFFEDNMTISNDSLALLQEIRDSYSNFRDSTLIESISELEGESALELDALEDISKPLSAPEEFHEDESHFEHIEDLDVDLLQTAAEKAAAAKKKANARKTAKEYRKNLKNQLSKQNSDVLDKAGREESLSRSLHAYLDLCVSSNLLNRGLATLMFYRCRGNRNNGPKVVDLNLYNIMLHGFAGKANYVKVKELLDDLREDKLPWTPQTFSAIFECLGRMPEGPENEKLIAKYRSEARSKGLSLNEIINKSKYTGDQREVVISAIKRLQPDFVPIYSAPSYFYDCSLLSELTKNVEIDHYAKNQDTNIPKDSTVYSADNIKSLARAQLQIELGGSVKVKNIQKTSCATGNVIHYRKVLKALEDNWKLTICDAFKRDLNTLKAQHNSLKAHRVISLYPYLRVLEVHQYADIIMKEVRRLAEGSETYSPTSTNLYRNLGTRVLDRYQIELKQRNGVLEKKGEIFGDFCNNISSYYQRLNSIEHDVNKTNINFHKNCAPNSRQIWQTLVHKNNSGPNIDIEDHSWPASVLSGVGRFLYNILTKDLKIDVNCIRATKKQENLLPAFYTLYRNQGRMIREEVKPHPVLSRLLRGSVQEHLILEPNEVPMLCPPVPWTSLNSGGYLISKTGIIRLPQQAVQQWERLKTTPQEQLYPSLDSLNQLASIPWKVNETVLDVILEVFNSGGSDKLDVPRPADSLKLPPPPAGPQTKQEKCLAFRNIIAIKKKQAEMHSLWCDALNRLSLANHFRDQVFWFPHNMDFRGRVYPCPPHLNHLGSDLARSILVFGMGKKLGPKGLDWLKIHCVNLTGQKKRESIKERLLFAEELMPDILDSADNPLTGRQWWAKSEEPWQTLACCIEISKAIRSPNPEEYVCHFPVHQDGSCNGLQHYAALGRDAIGAYSVNLVPEKTPQDVYSAVAALVEESRVKDAENGVLVAQNLSGFVKRKVIKQTVMTTVYGVTKFGARLQIARQLKDIDNFPKDQIWQASAYLTAKTFESLREMFTSTKEIQDWFTECARLISGICAENVEWVTPLGLPIVQPYNRNKKPASNNKKISEHFAMDKYEQPNVMKQKNAFPPNFIHSLDSSHMMLTSLFSERAGITFVSVHDCFWTHPSTVHIMNQICREQFVALHSEPILESLSEFLINKYSYSELEFANDGSVNDLKKRKLNQILKSLPSKGDFDLRNVLKSIYFFS